MIWIDNFLSLPRASSHLGSRLQALFSRFWKFSVVASRKKGSHITKTLKQLQHELRGQMESGPGALPGFKCCRAAVNSLFEKVSEIFTGFNVCKGSIIYVYKNSRIIAYNV